MCKYYSERDPQPLKLNPATINDSPWAPGLFKIIITHIGALQIVLASEVCISGFYYKAIQLFRIVIANN